MLNGDLLVVPCCSGSPGTKSRDIRMPQKHIPRKISNDIHLQPLISAPCFVTGPLLTCCPVPGKKLENSTLK